MNTEEIINSAIKLAPPTERFELIDRVLHSLDRPDPEIDKLWLEEAKQRLNAYRAGHIEKEFLQRLYSVIFNAGGVFTPGKIRI